MSPIEMKISKSRKKDQKSGKKARRNDSSNEPSESSFDEDFDDADINRSAMSPNETTFKKSRQ